ncbi:MAG: sugar phosphate isomerase/epimerase [Acidobacteriaceae bacterium]|nr:sugar phosphate isomerase/epimerase [Acidobacteriaceae bacterium]
MIKGDQFSRRTFLSAIAATPFALKAATEGKHIPVGLELYSVRDELKKDETATLRGVGKMGYECVEFFSPYYDWTTDHAKEVRKVLDDLGMKCYSTHNGSKSFSSDGLPKAMELNQALGAKYIVLASPGGKVSSGDDWKRVAEMLNKGNDKMTSEGLHAGYHNHIDEWKPIDGQMSAMQILADNTDKSVMLQLDVGHCVAAGADPIAWIESHPGRIRSMHLKDWSPSKEFNVLIGEGTTPWKKLLATAESKGGVEYYLIEQEGSAYGEMETADRSLIAFRNLRS